MRVVPTKVSWLGNPFFLQAVAWLGCAGNLQGLAAGAEPPASPSEPEVAHVEMWHGLNRVDSDAEDLNTGPLLTDATPQERTNGKDEGLASHTEDPPPDRVTLPPIKAIWRSCPGSSQRTQLANYTADVQNLARLYPNIPGSLAPAVLLIAERNVPVTAQVEKAASARLPADTTGGGKSSAGPTDAPSKATAPALMSAASPPAPRPDKSESGTEAAALSWTGLLVPVLCTVVASVFSPLVLTCALLLVRRRCGTGPLFRIECVTAPLPLAPGAACPVDQLQPSSGPSPPATGPDLPEETGQPFELGPTFEEERNLREQQGRQQEEAVLRYLFEQNVRLREQIATLPDSAETPPGDG